MERNKIVVRYTDGRVLKGYSQNFLPSGQVFHLLPPGGRPTGYIRSKFPI